MTRSRCEPDGASQAIRRVHVFLNGARGVPVARAIIDAGYDVVSLVVPSASAPAIKPVAPAPLTVRDDVNDPAFRAALAASEPDALVIAGFSTLFREPLLAVPRHGVLNLHAGRLPGYRGGSPLNWQMIAGETEAGLSVIRVDAGIDSGDVLAETTIPIGPRDTIADLHARANAAFPALTLAALARLADPTAGRRQNPAAARYWHQRQDADGHLRPDQLTAAEADRLIRALTHPYPGAFAFVDGERLRLLAAEIPDFDLRGVPGRVCRVQGVGPFVVCRDRALLLTDHRFEAAPERRLRHGEYLT